MGIKQENTQLTYPTDATVAKSSQKNGIKPQFGTITDDWLRTSAEIHAYMA